MRGVPCRQLHNIAYNAHNVHDSAYPPEIKQDDLNRAPETLLALDLNILVGTQTGIAELVAQALELRLEGSDIRVQTRLMDDLEPTVFTGQGVFLICTSTYGQGDVPDNAKQFYESLLTHRPDLSEVRYGVIALGDRTYAETFCNGGRRFDKVLNELGARRIGDILFHDASAGTLPEDEALEWIGTWIAQCLQTVEA
jgi:MioC protein